MFTRQGFGPAILLLLLTTHAAADYMYGYVNQIEDNHFSIRTRFFPEVGFDITSASETWLMSIFAQPGTSGTQSE
jgi:hypothetical protein